MTDAREGFEVGAAFVAVALDAVLDGGDFDADDGGDAEAGDLDILLELLILDFVVLECIVGKNFCPLRFNFSNDGAVDTFAGLAPPILTGILLGGDFDVLFGLLATTFFGAGGDLTAFVTGLLAATGLAGKTRFIGGDFAGGALDGGLFCGDAGFGTFAAGFGAAGGGDAAFGIGAGGTASFAGTGTEPPVSPTAFGIGAFVGSWKMCA